MTVLAARQGELDQAKEALRCATAEIEALTRENAGETDEEKAERKTIHETCKAITEQRGSQAQHYRNSLARLDAVIQGLPTPFDVSQLLQAEQAVGRAQTALNAADAALVRVIRDLTDGGRSGEASHSY